MSGPDPDFFILGAPKSGTTSLYAYLSRHPGVFMPRIKEPHFFSTDFQGLARVRDMRAYEALFADAPPGTMTGEASATYLFSKTAVPNILARRPHARFIVMLREPTAAVRSYHRQLLKGLFEDIEDFSEAWRAQADRAAGRRRPPTCPDTTLMRYGETFLYGEQLERLFDVTSPGQRYVVIAEEFFADPASGYRKVLAFLGLDDDGRHDFPVHNPSRALRSRWLARAYLAQPPWLRSFLAPVRRTANKFGFYPSESLQNLNTRAAPATPIDAALAAELGAFFAADVTRLERLIGRSLDMWKS